MAARPKAIRGEIAYGVHGDLRVIRTCLDAQITIGFQRVELVGGEVREALQGSRPQVAESETIPLPAWEQCRTKTQGDGHLCAAAGRWPQPVSSGGARATAGRRPELPSTETPRSCVRPRWSSP